MNVERMRSWIFRDDQCFVQVVEMKILAPYVLDLCEDNKVYTVRIP